MPPHDELRLDDSQRPTRRGLARLPARQPRVNERGHLEIGGCDVVELARRVRHAGLHLRRGRHPRPRARLPRAPSRPAPTTSRSSTRARRCPCTAVYRLLREEGLSVDVASGGELHIALRGRLRPGAHPHARQQQDRGRARATPFDAGVGHLILDSFDEIERAERLLDRAAGRADPGHARDQALHPRLRPDRPARLEVRLRARGRAGRARRSSGCARPTHLELVGLHAHIGSQIFELEPYARAIEVLAELADLDGAGCSTSAAGSASPTRPTDEPPSIEDYVDVKVARRAARSSTRSPRILIEPGRSLVGNAGVTAYTVGTVKEIPGVRTYVAVDGGMSDNLRPMLYGVPLRGGRSPTAPATPPRHAATVAGMHCESGDILIRDATLADPRVGDVLVTPATGAYGYAMANNYNGVPRPPVIFCRDGDARRRRAPRDLRGPDWRGTSMTAEPVRVGLLGHGTVGGAFRELLAERADAVEAATGRRPEIAGVLTPLARATSTRSSPARDVVVELIGGIEPARELRARARCAAGQATWSPPTSSCSPSTATSCSRPRASGRRAAALRGRGRRRGPGDPRDPGEPRPRPRSRRCFGIVNGTTNFILTEMARDRRLLRGRAGPGPGARLRRGRPDRGRRRRRRRGEDGDPRPARLRHARSRSTTSPTRGSSEIQPDDLAYAKELGLVAEAARRRRAPRRRASACASSPASSTAAIRWPRSRARSTRSWSSRRRSPRSRCRARAPAGRRPRRAVLGDVVSILSGDAPVARGRRDRLEIVARRRARPSTCTSRSPTGPACWPGRRGPRAARGLGPERRPARPRRRRAPGDGHAPGPESRFYGALAEIAELDFLRSAAARDPGDRGGVRLSPMAAGLIERYRDRLPLEAGRPGRHPQRGLDAAGPRAAALRAGRRRGLPEARGREPDRQLQGPRDDRRRLAGEGRRAPRRSSAPRPATPPRAPPPTRRAPGMRGAVIVPEGKIAIGKLAQALMHGARVIALRGNFDQALRDRPRARRHAPDRARQLGQPVPDRGPEDGRLRGLRRARRGARRARDPGRQRRQHHRLVGGLPGVRRRADPLRLPGRGRGAAGRRAHPVENPETVASAIRIGNPARWEEAMDAFTASRGRIAAVTDEQILDAYRCSPPREGVFCEPASAASVAGLLAHGLPVADGARAARDGRLRAHRPRPQGPRHRARQGPRGDRLRARPRRGRAGGLRLIPASAPARGREIG